MWVKLRLALNFTNILQASFTFKSILRSFYVLSVWVRNIWQMEMSIKASHKMLVKLTTSFNFTNIL